MTTVFDVQKEVGGGWDGDSDANGWIHQNRRLLQREQWGEPRWDIDLEPSYDPTKGQRDALGSQLATWGSSRV